MELRGLILDIDIFKMNIRMPRPFEGIGDGILVSPIAVLFSTTLFNITSYSYVILGA
jgi:hypothetical protein